MAEVAGLALAAGGALEQVLKLFKRIRNAKNRQEDLPHVLDQHEAIVRGTAALIGAIEEEDELNTAGILEAMGNVKAVSQELSTFIISLSAKVGRGAVQDFSHQLFKGSDDEKKLVKLVELLTSHKMDLSGAVSAAQVGLIMGAGGTRVVDVKQLTDVNQRLQDATNGIEKLNIAEILKGVEPDKNGMVTLSGPQIIAMARASYGAPQGPIELDEDEKAAYDSDKTVRIVKLNNAGRNALQMNAPIGKDMWADKDIVIVKNNVAEEGAIQANVPIEDPEIFLKMVQARYQAGLNT